MTTGDNVIAGLGAAVPSFLDRFFQARQFFDKEHQQQQMLDLNQGKLGVQQGNLGVAQGNLGLRSGELGLRAQAEQDANTRFGLGKNIDVWKSLTGSMGQQAPGAYAGGLDAMLQGDPNAFSQRMNAAQSLALQNQQTQAGRIAGTRSAAASGARSRQTEADNARMRQTRELERTGGLDQAVKGGFKPFYAKPRQAGEDVQDTLTKSGIRMGEKIGQTIEGRIKGGLGVPVDLAHQGALEYIRRDPQLSAAHRAASPATNKLNPEPGSKEFIEESVIDRQGWGDFIE